MGYEEISDFIAEYFDASLDLMADAISSGDDGPLGTIPWMDTAQGHLGLKEIHGKRHNAKIMSWADDVGGWVKNYYDKDEIPWCGLFIAGCTLANEIEIDIKNPLSALAWNKSGFDVEPCFGAIMVFVRKGGGHVGFYVSEDNNNYHILGGNQSDMVSVTKVRKNRFRGARWPSGYEQLHEANKGRIYKTFDGKVSTNEA